MMKNVKFSNNPFCYNCFWPSCFIEFKLAWVSDNVFFINIPLRIYPTNGQVRIFFQPNCRVCSIIIFAFIFSTYFALRGVISTHIAQPLSNF